MIFGYEAVFISKQPPTYSVRAQWGEVGPRVESFVCCPARIEAVLDVAHERLLGGGLERRKKTIETFMSSPLCLNASIPSFLA